MFAFPKKNPLKNIKEIKEKIEKAEKLLEGKGRILVRYSGTEPVARVMVEGDDIHQIRKIAKDLSKTIRYCLG